MRRQDAEHIQPPLFSARLLPGFPGSKGEKVIILNYQEALSYINNFTWSASRPGLERTEELLRRAGRPDEHLRFVHVAGTNGKGSTAAMIASILQQAGYRTGLYISPHLSDFRERMSVNGVRITEEELASLTSFLAPLADAMADHPSQFELSTVLALCHFYQQLCDIVVLEVGMGGLLDSTNVIEHPEVCLITNIGYDHTAFLGNTLASIARNKAGILKSGASACCYDMRESAPEAMREIEERAAALDIPLVTADFHQLAPLEESGSEKRISINHGKTRALSAEGASPSAGENKHFAVTAPSDGERKKEAVKDRLHGQDFIYKERPFHISLMGKHQLKNAALAIEAIEALRKRGFVIAEEALQKGLSLARWPARLELLSEDPIFLLDGGHNGQGAAAVASFIRETFPPIPPATFPDKKDGKTSAIRRGILLLSLLADKDIDAVLSRLLPLSSGVVCLTPESDRALPAEDLAKRIRETNSSIPVLTAEDAADAIRRSLQLAREQAKRVSDAGRIPVIAFGSLYSAGMLRSTFPAALRSYYRRTGIEAREALHPKERAEKSRRIAERIAASPAFQEAHTVMLYSAVRAEADLFPLLNLPEAQGKVFVYPHTLEDHQMIAVRCGSPWETPSDWSKGKYGIMEPVIRTDGSNIVRPSEIDLILCPLTAFDAQANRIGMGAGYYDRFLEKSGAASRRAPENAKKRPHLIGVAFSCQRAPRIPAESWDIPMDAVYTEDAVYRP